MEELCADEEVHTAFEAEQLEVHNFSVELVDELVEFWVHHIQRDQHFP